MSNIYSVFLTVRTPTRDAPAVEVIATTQIKTDNYNTAAELSKHES